MISMTFSNSLVEHLTFPELIKRCFAEGLSADDIVEKRLPIERALLSERGLYSITFSSFFKILEEYKRNQ
ncbi:hypothetical protein DX928_00695 [Bacillus swezeyi]|nr:hypothetical protein DX928_00695 [Bacillus swezeyi]